MVSAYGLCLGISWDFGTHIFTKRRDCSREGVAWELEPLADTRALSSLCSLEGLPKACLAGGVDHGGCDLCGHDEKLGLSTGKCSLWGVYFLKYLPYVGMWCATTPRSSR